jgi:hypothetical protein
VKAEEMCILDTCVRNPKRSVLHEACLKVSHSCYAWILAVQISAIETHFQERHRVNLANQKEKKLIQWFHKNLLSILSNQMKELIFPEPLITHWHSKHKVKKQYLWVSRLANTKQLSEEKSLKVVPVPN